MGIHYLSFVGGIEIRREYIEYLIWLFAVSVCCGFVEVFFATTLYEFIIQTSRSHKPETFVEWIFAIKHTSKRRQPQIRLAASIRQWIPTF